MDRLAVAIKAMLERIAAPMEALRHTHAAIAHDLRTPLARLRQVLESARAAGMTRAHCEAAIDRALAETDAILRSFSAVLRIARIESGSRRAGFAPCALSDLAATMAEAYGPAIEESGRRLVTDIAPRMAIRGDRDLLAQAIANLIENAMRHTAAGTTILLRVDVAAGVGRGPVLSVEDDGPGVPASERQRILRAFHRLGPTRTDGGSGLGLAPVAAVAALHDAELVRDHARSDGRGLAVRLHFPAEHRG